MKDEEYNYVLEHVVSQQSAARVARQLPPFLARVRKELAANKPPRLTKYARLIIDAHRHRPIQLRWAHCGNGNCIGPTTAVRLMEAGILPPLAVAEAELREAERIARQEPLKPFTQIAHFGPRPQMPERLRGSKLSPEDRAFVERRLETLGTPWNDSASQKAKKSQVPPLRKLAPHRRNARTVS